MHEGTWTLADCPPDAQAELVRELGISELTAAVLVRRGYSDPAVARRFLDGEQPPHDPFLLGDMEAACGQIRAAVEERRRICVHGDYDVDGIAATTLAVLLLRELGADVAWHLPSRFDEGYGVRSETLARLADEGCGLVLTVDCGITAVDEVAEARERGLDVVVTDHHRPGETLPDCPIVATRPSAYPFPELCGTGVVYKLGQALFGVESEFPGVISTSSRSRRSPTSSRSSTRTDRSPSPACAPSRARRSPVFARSCRAPASTRPRSTPGPSASVWRRA